MSGNSGKLGGAKAGSAPPVRMMRLTLFTRRVHIQRLGQVIHDLARAQNNRRDSTEIRKSKASMDGDAGGSKMGAQPHSRFGS